MTTPPLPGPVRGTEEPHRLGVQFPRFKLLLAVFVIAGVGFGARATRAPELRELAVPVPGDSARVTMWVAFRPADCRLPPNLIHELNLLDRSRAVTVRGVLLNPIEDPVEAERVIAALGIRFHVLTTESTTWRAAARAARQPDPILIILEGDRRLGTFSPRLIRSIRTYLPSALYLGADP